MSVKHATLFALSLMLPVPALASVWLADVEVTEMTAERVTAEVPSSCRTYVLTDDGLICETYNMRAVPTGEIAYTVEITNHVDDTARNLQAKFFLPHGADFLSTDSDACVPGPAIGGQTGLVECDFGWVSPRQSVSFSVVTTLPEEHPYNISWGKVDSTATVFAFSDSPDWNMENNMASVSAD